MIAGLAFGDRLYLAIAYGCIPVIIQDNVTQVRLQIIGGRVELAGGGGLTAGGGGFVAGGGGLTAGGVGFAGV
eukprot:24152-Prorocentrum_minimum.AAC.2